MLHSVGGMQLLAHPFVDPNMNVIKVFGIFMYICKPSPVQVIKSSHKECHCFMSQTYMSSSEKTIHPDLNLLVWRFPKVHERKHHNNHSSLKITMAVGMDRSLTTSLHYQDGNSFIPPQHHTLPGAFYYQPRSAY